MKQLTKTQRRVLSEYAELKISLAELRERLRGVLEIDFKNHERTLVPHYRDPELGIRIELRHVRDAMDKHAREEITTEQLADWATMLLLNQAYDWQGPDEDQIADWLNEISMLTLKPKAQAEMQCPITGIM